MTACRLSIDCVMLPDTSNTQTATITAISTLTVTASSVSTTTPGSTATISRHTGTTTAGIRTVTSSSMTTVSKVTGKTIPGSIVTTTAGTVVTAGRLVFYVCQSLLLFVFPFFVLHICCIMLLLWLLISIYVTLSLQSTFCLIFSASF